MTPQQAALMSAVLDPTPRPVAEMVTAAEALLVDPNGVPETLVAALWHFVEVPASIDDLRAEAVRMRVIATSTPWLVKLVAVLALSGRLSLKEGASALGSIPPRDRRTLPEAAQHLIDVAEAVLEDERDNVMGIEEDRTLREAMEDLDR